MKDESRVQAGEEEGKGLLTGDNWRNQQEQRCREINMHSAAWLGESLKGDCLG